jgi:chloramphenicol 3-O-phosphotransferase
MSVTDGVLIERERRTGRWGGIAEGSVHADDGWAYDIDFDTTDNPDLTDIAREVLGRANVTSAQP